MPTEKWRLAHIDELRAYRRKHYYANKEQYCRRNKEAKRKKVAYINEAKNVACTDCGKKYPSYVMDFDHVHGEKYKNLSLLRNAAWSRIKAEIAKCEVVCANCHRIRTQIAIFAGRSG